MKQKTEDGFKVWLVELDAVQTQGDRDGKPKGTEATRINARTG